MTRALTTTVSTSPRVYSNGVSVYATSKDVAAFFGKNHFDVLRDIRDLVNGSPSIGRDFASIELPVKVGFGTRMDPAYEMTRDGFSLLAMGFTGKRALAFKLRYIEEFNRMEAQLRAPSVPALPDFTDPGEAAIAWIMFGKGCEKSSRLVGLASDH